MIRRLSYKLLHILLLETNFWVTMKYLFKEKLLNTKCLYLEYVKIFEKSQMSVFSEDQRDSNGEMWYHHGYQTASFRGLLTGYLSDLPQPRPEPCRLRTLIFISINKVASPFRSKQKLT